MITAQRSMVSYDSVPCCPYLTRATVGRTDDVQHLAIMMASSECTRIQLCCDHRRQVNFFGPVEDLASYLQRRHEIPP